MAKFYDLFMNFMLIGLIVLSLFAFSISFQNENNIENQFLASNILMNESYYNLRENLDSLRLNSQAQKTLFESENPTAGYGTILLFSIVSSGKVFNGMIISLFNILIKLPVVILGIDPIVVSVITTMLIITLIVGLWIIYKIGG